MKRLLSLALAASLCACSTTGGVSLPDRLANAGPTIDRIQARYDQASAFAALLLPYLPPARQAQVRAAQAAVAQALAVARAAATLAEQRAAITAADKAAATLEVVADTAPASSQTPG